MTEALRLEHVFLSRYKLWNINLTVYAGEILAVVAQSHTCRQGLIELVTGGVLPDSGKLYLRGGEARLTSRLSAKQHGIGCVRARSQLVPGMAVYENIFINREGSYLQRLHSKKFYCGETAQLLAEAGLSGIAPTAPVWSVSQASCHIIEIVKATSLHADILFIDNITDKYTSAEMQNLMRLVRKLRDEGLSVVLLANKHSELFSVADRVSVIRGGTTAAHIGHGGVGKQELYHYMAAAPLPGSGLHRAAGEDAVALRARGLQTEPGGRSASFSVHTGEVFGILETDQDQGLAWGEALCGRRPFFGEVAIGGKPAALRSPNGALREGIGFVAENEFGNNVHANMGLLDNITLMLDPRYDHPLGLMNKNVRMYKMKQALALLDCEDLLDRYGAYGQLRGVNREDQMKITLAKWLCAAPRVLVMMNPQLSFTELSMPAFSQMVGILTRQGMAVIIISTNMSSVTPLCDRIVSFEEDAQEASYEDTIC